MINFLKSPLWRKIYQRSDRVEKCCAMFYWEIDEALPLQYVELNYVVGVLISWASPSLHCMNIAHSSAPHSKIPTAKLSQLRSCDRILVTSVIYAVHLGLPHESDKVFQPFLTPSISNPIKWRKLKILSRESMSSVTAWEPLAKSWSNTFGNLLRQTRKPLSQWFTKFDWAVRKGFCPWIKRWKGARFVYVHQW